jgi:hypothetical protein
MQGTITEFTAINSNKHKKTTFTTRRHYAIWLLCFIHIGICYLKYTIYIQNKINETVIFSRVWLTIMVETVKQGVKYGYDDTDTVGQRSATLLGLPKYWRRITQHSIACKLARSQIIYEDEHLFKILLGTGGFAKFTACNATCVILLSSDVQMGTQVTQQPVLAQFLQKGKRIPIVIC